MLTLPSALIAEKNKLYTSGAFLELLEIQLSEASQTLRVINNNEDITWNSQIWSRFFFEAGDISESEEGENHTLEIRVDNVERTVQSFIESATDGLVGDTVVYRLIHSDNLSLAAAITASFTILSIECTEQWCTFTLGLENFFLKRYPLHTYSRNFCRYEVFKGSECLYAGADLVCDRKFTTCIGFGHEARFGGQPGIPGGQFDI